MSKERSLTIYWRQCDSIMKNNISNFCKQQELLYVDRIIVDALYDLGESTKKQLSSHVKSASESLTRSLNRLHDQGIVQINNSKTDGRYKFICLSEDGVIIAKKLRRATNQLWSRLLDGVTLSQRESFEKVLQHIALSEED